MQHFYYNQTKNDYNTPNVIFRLIIMPLEAILAKPLAIKYKAWTSEAPVWFIQQRSLQTQLRKFSSTLECGSKLPL